MDRQTAGEQNPCVPTLKKNEMELHQRGLLDGQGTRSLKRQPHDDDSQGLEGRCASFIVQCTLAAPT